MLGKLIGIAGLLCFAGLMWVITIVIHNIRARNPEFEEKQRAKEAAQIEKRNAPKKKSALEKYCNDQKNDSRRQLANYILIHDKEERKKRGQID